MLESQNPTNLTRVTVFAFLFLYTKCSTMTTWMTWVGYGIYKMILLAVTAFCSMRLIAFLNNFIIIAWSTRKTHFMITFTKTKFFICAGLTKYTLPFHGNTLLLWITFSTLMLWLSTCRTLITFVPFYYFTIIIYNCIKLNIQDLQHMQIWRVRNIMSSKLYSWISCVLGLSNTPLLA